MNLYEISAELQAALDALEVDPETGEATGWEAVEALEMERDAKLENYALAVKNYRSDAGQIGEEIKKLQARKKSAEHWAERLEGCIAHAMEQSGQKRFSTPRTAISFRLSEAVHIIDLQLLAEDYKRQKPAEPDKTAIKRALKSGVEVPGAELVTNRNLQIK